MRNFLVLTAALAVGGFLSIGLGGANASPLPRVATAAHVSGVEKVGYWRRYYRNQAYAPYAYGYAPYGYAYTAPVYAAPVAVAPVIPTAPLVPYAACGAYYYWNGVSCVPPAYVAPY